MLGLIKKIEKFFYSKKSYKFIIRDWIKLNDLKKASEVIGTMRYLRNLSSYEMLSPDKKNIIVIAPHPDDEMIGPGGTILKSLSKGINVHCICLTNGKKGEIAKKESHEVAKKYGYSINFLNLEVENINIDQESQDLLKEIITEKKADCIFVPFFLDDHDDHRRANELVYKCFFNNLNDHKIIENLEVWAYQVYTSLIPNVVVDITEFAEDKKEAIKMWSSQSSRDWAHYSLGLNAYNTRFVSTKGEKKYIEAFFVLPLKDYLFLCKKYFSQPKDCYYLDNYKK